MTTTELGELRQIERELALAARGISNAESRLAHLLTHYKVRINPAEASSHLWDLHAKVKQAADLFSVTR